MRVSLKFTHVIMALIMSVSMMFAMTGTASAAGCNNPAHQHTFSLTSNHALVLATRPDETIIKSDNFNTVSSIKHSRTNNAFTYNSNGSHRVLADSGSGGLLRHSRTVAYDSGKGYLNVAFKHRLPPDGWEAAHRQ